MPAWVKRAWRWYWVGVKHEWRWLRAKDSATLALVTLTGLAMGVAVSEAETAADRALAVIAGLATFAALSAIRIGNRTYEEQRLARREDAAERRRQRLEAVSELALQIAEAASSGSWDRWRFARRRLRVALAALGPDVVLENGNELVEVEPGYQNEGHGVVAAQFLLDEVVEKFTEVA